MIGKRWGGVGFDWSLRNPFDTLFSEAVILYLKIMSLLYLCLSIGPRGLAYVKEEAIESTLLLGHKPP